MSEKEQPKCFFTGENATRKLLENYDGWRYESEGCGEYWIDNHTIQMFKDEHELPIAVKLNCASETIKLNEIGLKPCWGYNFKELVGNKIEFIVDRDIKSYESIPISHSKKPESILELLSKKLGNSLPFDSTYFSIKDMYKLKIADEMEFLKWLLPLYHNDYIQVGTEAIAYLNQGDERFLPNVAEMMFRPDAVQLTPKGWRTIEQSGSSGEHAFVAMAFTDNEGNSVNPELRVAIKDACESVGWVTKIVDEEEHNDGIMDKVISLINESSFVIAELTHQKSGVYYEAGYGKGRGLPVIHIVSKSDLASCHFDVKHLNLVVWEDISDLKEKLQNRITATIGSRKSD